MKRVALSKTLLDRLTEHVEFLQCALGGTDIAMETWLGDPDRFDLLDDENPDALQRESLTYSWGFIVGAAEALGCTPDALVYEVEEHQAKHEPDCQPRRGV